ncbi:TPR-like protein [Aspergillus lucknowensis]|uniref:TPR-like protein n=1 Tax=Aspergillus lucknowensis TaxID=176173 RepID=A0ABR4M259_9EURO
MEVISGISAVIGLLDASIELFKHTQKDLKLSEMIETVGRQLLIIRSTLEACHTHLLPRRDTIPEDVAEALEKTLDACETKAYNLKKIFVKITPDQSTPWQTRYAAIVRRLGKGSKVEELMRAITEDVQIIVNHHAAPEDFSFHEPAGIRLGRAPFIAAELFVGREKELNKIAETIQPVSESHEQQRLVLGGMGGIGKTQLAIAYAKSHHHSYSSVFWLNAESEATLNDSFLSIAKQIFKLQQPDKLRGEEAVIHVCQWLSDPQNPRWLLIFDNYDDPGEYEIEQYYPLASHGVLLITTRQPNRVAGKKIMVQPLRSIEDGLVILQRRSEQVNAKDDPHARKLAERLAGLPLALATAGAFLRQSTLTFEHYLQEYENHWNIDPRRPVQLEEYQNRTLFTTWDLSYTRLKADDPKAGELLTMLAYFGNQSLWYELFNAGLTNACPQWLRELVHNQISLDSAMKTLADYCFLEVQTQQRSWSMHMCVHDWTLTVLNKAIDSQKYWYAFECVAGSIPDNTEYLEHSSLSGIAVHATRLIHPRFVQAGILDNIEESRLAEIGSIAILLQKQVQFVAAEEMYQRALAGCEKALGPDHISTLGAVHNLGNLYFNQGKLNKAEEIYQRALVGFTEALGPDHISILDIAQGKLNKAEEIYQQALVGFMESLGPDHISTLDTVHNLGILYKAQGKLNKAEEMYLQALVGFTEALGPEHPKTLAAAKNLSSLASFR